MRKLFTIVGNGIRKIIDFFYPPFKRWASPQFFRYAVCGGSNVVFDLLLYFITFHFVLHKQMLHIGCITLSSHIASLSLVFPITTFTGFLLQKYVTFTNSDLQGRVQLFRYLLVVAANLLINYLGLKLFVDVFHFFPTPSKMLVSIIAIAFSYFSQRKYTFKVTKKTNEKQQN